MDCNCDISVEQIANWLKILVEPESTVEMRVLRNTGAPHVRHYSSDDLETLAKDAVRLSKGAKGVYWLMNPLPVDWKCSPATDADVTRRRWLLVDCDPNRTGVVSSTDEEKDAARKKIVEVDEYLSACGWPAPVIADSGNGWHLLYRIDLPNDDKKLIHRALQALARQFNDDEVTIDTKVGNASRICKLYGTIAAKGENSIDRPHRVSTINSIPENLEIVPVELIKKLVDDDGQIESQTYAPRINPTGRGVSSRPEALEQASKYIASMTPSISGQKGHDKLLRAASILVNDFGLTDEETFDLLAAEFNHRCEPPWENHDIHRKISEAKKNPPNRTPKDSVISHTVGNIGIGSRGGFQSQKTTTKAIVVRLSDVEEQHVEWLWPNRIPLGKLTLLAGDPGLGKSFVTVDMAARVSTGRGWPDCFGQGQPVGSVIMFNCEDDIADTVLPRLKRAGGDPSKVIALQGVATTDLTTGQRRERGFSLDVDLPKLVEVLEANEDVRLVVIDPVSAYCGGTDSHKNSDIRAMLAPMSEMASKYRVAVVMVTHLAKGGGGKAVYRAMGSLAFSAASRAVWHVAKDHEDDKRRLILLVKMNVCEEATGLAYRLNDGVVCWEDLPVAMTADEHLAQEAQSERRQRGNESGQLVQEASKWLVDKLSASSIQAKEIQQMANDDGITLATLKRAKKLAKVESRRIGFGKKSILWWTLSESENELCNCEVTDRLVVGAFP